MSKVASSMSRQSSLASLASWYSRQLDQRPLLTKGITSGLIGASGDLICQYLSSNKPTEDGALNTPVTTTHIDWHRTGRFFIMGSLWVAPVTNYWYTALSMRLVPGKASVTRVTKRLVLDQFGFAPLFCPSFMALLWLLEGQDMTMIAPKLKEVAPDIIVANWFLWIPAMTINFSMIPLKFQVLFGNVVALVWNVYLSYMSTKGATTAEVDGN